MCIEWKHSGWSRAVPLGIRVSTTPNLARFHCPEVEGLSRTRELAYAMVKTLLKHAREAALAYGLVKPDEIRRIQIGKIEWDQNGCWSFPVYMENVEHGHVFDATVPSAYRCHDIAQRDDAEHDGIR